MEPSNLILCYRLGCQQKFDPAENTATSCTFHPGVPFFHDAYKGWSCCKKKCVDFTEFLNIRGCATGFHSNEPPPEPEKKETPADVPTKTETAQPTLKPMARPCMNSPLIHIVPSVTPSLQNMAYKSRNSNTDTLQSVSNALQEIKIGESCYNNGCKEIYEGLTSKDGVCNYHPGVPIFHEGYKYWSCCKKKTTEFEVFQSQKGCTTGNHLWIKPAVDTSDSAGNKVITCRNDWIQTGANIIVTIYAKKCDPAKSKINVNGVKLEIEIFFPEEDGYFRQTWILAGIIETDKCSATMTPNKIEITMKKAEPVFWKSLDIVPEKLEALNSISANTVKNTGVDAVDLDDL